MTIVVQYLDEYVLDEGIQRFTLPRVCTFVCTIKNPHRIETDIIFQSDKQKGTFVFCPKHYDFIDVSIKPEGKP